MGTLVNFSNILKNTKNANQRARIHHHDTQSISIERSPESGPPDQQKRWTATWRERVRARIIYLRAQAGRAQAIGNCVENEPIFEAITKCLDDAEGAAREPDRWPRRMFFHSAELERAWTKLHTAEVLLLQILPERDLASRKPDILARAKYHLSPDDLRFAAVNGSSGATPPIHQRRVDRNELVSLLDSTYQVEDAELARVRSLRNILWATTIFVCMGVAVFSIWIWLHPSMLSLCFEEPGASIIACPSGEYPAGRGLTPTLAAKPQDVIAVEMAGLAGAALTIIASLRRIPGTSTPYGLSLAAAVLKFPTGALTAVLGILLIHGGFLPGLSNLDNRAQVLAWAVAFGVSQHLVTRLVDQRAQKTLSEAGKAGDPEDLLLQSKKAGSQSPVARQ